MLDHNQFGTRTKRVAVVAYTIAESTTDVQTMLQKWLKSKRPFDIDFDIFLSSSSLEYT